MGQHKQGDLMTLTINNNNCDTLSVNFFINSHDRERAENGKNLLLKSLKHHTMVRIGKNIKAKFM